MTTLPIVDDSAVDREFIEDLITMTGSHAVTGVPTGREALDHLAREGALCVFLDYRLNAEDGLEILAQIKATHPAIPVIIMSGVGNEEVAVAAMAAGASDYLVKKNLSAGSVRKALTQALSRAALERKIEEQSEVIERRGRLDALGQLAAGISHDFNNILATIRFAINLTLQDNLSAESKRYLQASLQSIERGAALTDRLLSFGRMEPAAKTNRTTDQVMREFETLVCSSLSQRPEIVFRNDIPQRVGNCDQGQLHNALLNLVLNARDAILNSGQGDRIDLVVQQAAGLGETSAGGIAFVATDNGPGMPEDVLRQCTDPFFTTKPDRSGTGLGLAMIYGFAKQSGGELQIKSAVGEGTSVSLLLPGTDLEGDDPKVRPDALPHVSRTILLVEDDLAQLMMLEDLLTNAGHMVLACRTSADALDHAGERIGIDVLLTDVQLAGDTGFELASAVRGLRPDLPVVYMSGYSGYADSDMEGAEGPMLRKPCDLDEMIRTIEQQLAGQRSPEHHLAD